jgi:WD40 repeat protein
MQKLATVSSDKTIKLWNIDGFTLDRTLTGTPRSRQELAVKLTVLRWF